MRFQPQKKSIISFDAPDLVMSAFATRSLCRRKLCCPHCGSKPFLTSSSGSCCPLATCASYESSSAALWPRRLARAQARHRLQVHGLFGLREKVGRGMQRARVGRAAAAQARPAPRRQRHSQHVRQQHARHLRVGRRLGVATAPMLVSSSLTSALTRPSLVKSRYPSLVMYAPADRTVVPSE